MGKTNFPHNPVSPTFDSLEVFVSIGGNDYETYIPTKTILQSFSGTIYLSYCTNHGVFMVYIDRNIYPTANDFLMAIRKASPLYASKITLKDGKFSGLLPFCDATDPIDNGSIKNNLGK